MDKCAMQWAAVPIPINSDGAGPCNEADAVRTEWQVWDELNLLVCVCDQSEIAAHIVEVHNAFLASP